MVHSEDVCRVTAMAALAPGVGLIPLALRAGSRGREIQQPMAVVILGAVGASTFLNMIVIPALYLKFGGGPPQNGGRRFSAAKP